MEEMQELLDDLIAMLIGVNRDPQVAQEAVEFLARELRRAATRLEEIHDRLTNAG